jgi:hypothetical protein
MRKLTGLLATPLICALLAAAALLAQPAQPALAASGCTGYRAGSGWWVQCHSTPAGQPPAATGGGGGQPVCTWSSDLKGYFPGFTQNAPPPPTGYIYLIQICGKTYGLPQLVATGGAAVTPAALAQQAYKELRPPVPAARTAPPRGSHGLVGLPEWFWVPRAQWAPQTREVTAGGQWARVTATPSTLAFSPGAALAAVTCPGPGTAYDKALPAAGQATSCTYTYVHSSAQLPGGAYTASVSITWTAAWVGSGGTGGTLAPITRTTTFRLPVAEAQALVGSGG